MKKRILLVEDNSSLRRIIAHYFERELISVVEASNGNNALKILATVYADYIDLILTDYIMPYLNGYDMAIRVRSMEAFKRIPIILYTNFSCKELERKKGFSVFNRVLCKASTELMIKTIDEFIN